MFRYFNAARWFDLPLLLDVTDLHLFRLRKNFRQLFDNAVQKQLVRIETLAAGPVQAAKK